MNIIILKESELKEGRAEVSGKQHKHLKETLKKTDGDEVKAGVLGGKLGTALVERIGKECAVLRFTPDTDPPVPLKVNLALALPRPKVLRRVLYAVTCLGVKNIHIFNSWRVEKSYWSSPLLNELDDYLVPALEQSKDTILPQITFHRFFTPFVKEILPEISKNTLRIAAHPAGSGLSVKPSEPVTLAIGAEGGFIQKELDTLEDSGFSFFSVGERVLNVETAVPYILGRLF
jgi:RsmE family RNA methyltransferase